jgi:hypothetical protein
MWVQQIMSEAGWNHSRHLHSGAALVSQMQAWSANVMPLLPSQTARELGGVTVLWQSLLRLGQVVTRHIQEAEGPIAARDRAV